MYWVSGGHGRRLSARGDGMRLLSPTVPDASNFGKHNPVITSFFSMVRSHGGWDLNPRLMGFFPLLRDNGGCLQ